MKRIIYLAAIACMALFVSCEKEDVVSHTGDETGTLYGIWTLTTKSEITQKSNGEQEVDEVDYRSRHFYLSLSEFPFPHAIAKKGSFTQFDLDDVDVDAVEFTYNAEQKKISFKKTLWLSDDFLTYNMILSGTYDITELTKTKLVLQQKEITGTTIAYTYQKEKQKEE